MVVPAQLGLPFSTHDPGVTLGMVHVLGICCLCGHVHAVAGPKHPSCLVAAIPVVSDSTLNVEPANK